MLVIICAKYWKNTSTAVCVAKGTRQDVLYFSSFIAVPAEWPWRYMSRSKVIVHNTPSHASDHLCPIWKVSIQNCRSYRADTACETDGWTEWNKYTPINNFILREGYHYKILLLAYKAQHGRAPSYLSSFLYRRPLPSEGEQLMLPCYQEQCCRHICLMLHLHNATWHFIIMCTFCQVSAGVCLI